MKFKMQKYEQEKKYIFDVFPVKINPPNLHMIRNRCLTCSRFGKWRTDEKRNNRLFLPASIHHEEQFTNNAFEALPLKGGSLSYIVIMLNSTNNIIS